MPSLPNHLRLPLTRRFQQSIATVTERTAPSVQRVWDGLDNYDEESIPTLAAKSAQSMSTLKAASFTAASGFYATLTGRQARNLRAAHVSAEAAFRDPFIATWRAFKEGRSYDEAVAAGRSRVEAIVANLANSTARQTGDAFVRTAGIKADGWERVTNPGACEWCQQVAGNTYGSADSADFGHDRCGCTAVPRL